MPNWTSINLEFEGPSNIIERLRSECFTDVVLDFEKIVPKPEGFDASLPSPAPIEVETLLRDKCVSSNPLDMTPIAQLIAVATSHRVEDYPWVKEAEPDDGWTTESLVAFLRTRKKNMTPEEVQAAYRDVERGAQAYKRNVEVGAYPTWYEWNNVNWGTKWNAVSCHVSIEMPGYLQVSFSTAWDAPRPVFNALRAKYPQLRMKWVAEFEGGPQIEGEQYWPEEDDEA